MGSKFISGDLSHSLKRTNYDGDRVCLIFHLQRGESETWNCFSRGGGGDNIGLGAGRYNALQDIIKSVMIIYEIENCSFIFTYNQKHPNQPTFAPGSGEEDRVCYNH